MERGAERDSRALRAGGCCPGRRGCRVAAQRERQSHRYTRNQAPCSRAAASAASDQRKGRTTGPDAPLRLRMRASARATALRSQSRPDGISLQSERSYSQARPPWQAQARAKGSVLRVEGTARHRAALPGRRHCRGGRSHT